MHRVIAASLIVLTAFFSTASAAGAYCLDGRSGPESGVSPTAADVECDHESCPMHADRSGRRHAVEGGDAQHGAARGGAHIKCCRHGVDAVPAFASFDAAMPVRVTAPPNDSVTTFHEAERPARSEPSFHIDRPPKV